MVVVRLFSFRYIVISDNKHIVFFGYWTYFEYTKGQSIGKMVMRIKTTDLYGNKPSLKSVMLGSLGKSFFLVIDVILGWIFTNEKRQRIFNRAGNTIVIKIVDDTKTKGQEGSSNITYGKDWRIAFVGGGFPWSKRGEGSRASRD